MTDQELIRKAAEAMWISHRELAFIADGFRDEYFGCTQPLASMPDSLILIWHTMAEKALSVFYEHRGKQKSEARSQESE